MQVHPFFPSWEDWLPHVPSTEPSKRQGIYCITLHNYNFHKWIFEYIWLDSIKIFLRCWIFQCRCSRQWLPRARRYLWERWSRLRWKEANWNRVQVSLSDHEALLATFLVESKSSPRGPNAAEVPFPFLNLRMMMVSRMMMATRGRRIATRQMSHCCFSTLLCVLQITSASAVELSLNRHFNEIIFCAGSSAGFQPDLGAAAAEEREVKLNFVSKSDDDEKDPRQSKTDWNQIREMTGQHVQSVFCRQSQSLPRSKGRDW